MASMFFLQCPDMKCGHVVRYCGMDDGYFVKNNGLVFDMLTMYDLAESFKNKMTITAFTSMLQGHIVATGGTLVLDRGVLSSAFASFCKSIDPLALNHECRSCDCSRIIVDGVRAAPMLDRNDGVIEKRPVVQLRRQLKLRDFYLIPDHRQRSLWLAWAGLRPHGKPAARGKGVIFLPTDMTNLMDIVRGSQNSFMLPLLDFYVGIGWSTGVPRSNDLAMAYFRLFVRSIACAHVAYPIITGYVPGKLETLQRVADAFRGDDPLNDFALHASHLTMSGMAAFAAFLTHAYFRTLTQPHKIVLLRVFGGIINNMNVISMSYHAAVADLQSPRLERVPVTREQDVLRGASFAEPHRLRLPVELQLPPTGSRREPTGQCEKDFGFTSSAFMDCILMFWCLCGINLGFVFLNRPESVAALMFILIERFPTMPREFIFDFACGLMRIGVGYAPWHFERTRMCQDSFHGGQSLDLSAGKSHCTS